METGTRKGLSIEWTEQDRLDAARLLQVLEQRSNQRMASGSLNSPENLTDQPLSPADKGPGAMRNGEDARQAPGQHADLGRQGSDHVAGGSPAGNGNGLVKSEVVVHPDRPRRAQGTGANAVSGGTGGE